MEKKLSAVDIDEVLSGDAPAPARSLAAVPAQVAQTPPEEDGGGEGARQAPRARVSTDTPKSKSRTAGKAAAKAEAAETLPDCSGEQRLVGHRHPAWLVDQFEDLVHDLKQKNRRITKQDVLSAMLHRELGSATSERAELGALALEIRRSRESGGS